MNQYICIIMTFKNTTKYLLNIKTWIITFFLFRLYGIINMPIEVLHNWRQTTVTMVARNFLEVDNNILYPRIDIGGDLTGITAMEFPFFNYLIYLTSVIFGYDHWYGRLINLTISSIGLYYFYLFIKKKFSQQTAFYSTLLLLFSIWFSFSRKIMPDTFATSLVIIGIYYGFKFLQEKASIRNLAYYTIFTFIGVASKLPVGYFLILFAIPILKKPFFTLPKLSFVLISILFLIPIYWWYFQWTPYLTEQYKLVHFFMGKSMIVGLQECLNNMDKVFLNFYESPFYYIGFIFYCIGLYFLIKNRHWKILLPSLLLFFMFGIVMLKAGHAFYCQNYYVIPFAPIMALIITYAIQQFPTKWHYWIIAAISLNSLVPKLRDLTISSKRLWAENLEQQFDTFSNTNDLIFINQEQSSTYMYCTHRKGWLGKAEDLQNSNYRENLINRGCKYALIVQAELETSLSEYQLPYPIIFQEKEFKVYQLY